MALAFLCCTRVACAGVYSDDLGKCLVAAATDADRTAMARWLFVELARSLAVASMSSVTSEAREAIEKDFAAMVQRLSLHSCREQLVTGLKYEGPAVLSTSFNLWGQVAGAQLFRDPQTAAGLANFGKYFDAQAWGQVGKEAGVALNVGAKPQ